MRGVTVAMLVALIAFVIAIVSLGLEYLGVFNAKSLISNFSNESFLLHFTNFHPVLIKI